MFQKQDNFDVTLSNAHNSKTINFRENQNTTFLFIMTQKTYTNLFEVKKNEKSAICLNNFFLNNGGIIFFNGSNLLLIEIQKKICNKNFMNVSQKLPFLDLPIS